MLAAGIAVLVLSILAYVFMSAYVAGEYRKLGWDRRTGSIDDIPKSAIPDIPRGLLVLQLASYPGAVIGAILIALALL